ncbi:MAG: YhbY family RNA-binding protein [Methanomicrobiaceae archaeon]|nr:YhbY family RNA-binding protein [Methanomicrobiaceae archaeon]
MHRLRATIWIGKNGCTEQTIREISAQLGKRRVIKIRWLRNTTVNPEKIAALCNARLIFVRGRTMILEMPGTAGR